MNNARKILIKTLILQIGLIPLYYGLYDSLRNFPSQYWQFDAWLMFINIIIYMPIYSILGRKWVNGEL